MKNASIKIASLVVLAISFYNSLQSQVSGSLAISKEVNESCENKSNPYLELGANYNLWISPLDSSIVGNVKKVKIKSKEISLSSDGTNLRKFVAKPLKSGVAAIKAKVILNDGTKLIQDFYWTISELPQLNVEITVTSPDSKFMWLNLIEKSTGQSANSSFNLCSIDFVLSDSSGNLKEAGKSVIGDEYFPSVTLRKLPIQFQIHDRLKLDIIVTHYESNLPVFISQELIIKSLWH